MRSTAPVGGRGEESGGGNPRGARKPTPPPARRVAPPAPPRRYLAQNPKDFDPRKFLAATTKAMKEICKARYEAFGCAGQAAKIKPISLDAMVSRYAKGELNPIIK